MVTFVAERVANVTELTLAELALPDSSPDSGEGLTPTLAGSFLVSVDVAVDLTGGLIAVTTNQGMRMRYIYTLTTSITVSLAT